MSMNFSGMMKMPPNKQMPQGMTIPMLIEGTITVEPMKNTDDDKEIPAESANEQQGN